MQALWQKVAEILSLMRLEKRWQKLAKALSIVVVFCVTYMLILPAVTMENEPCCGLSEHKHDENCYVVETKLICSYEDTVQEETTADDTTDVPETETTAEITETTIVSTLHQLKAFNRVIQ